MDARPTVRCLVAYALPDGDWRVSTHVLELADAEVLVGFGWSVAIDPADEAVLARWQQLDRTMRGKGPRLTW